MTLQSSGAISMSQIRSEFGGGSGAISFADFYRGAGSGKVRAKQSNNTATNLAASVPTSGAISFSNFYGQARAFRKTYTSNATNQNASTIFGSDFGVNYPKEIVINSGVELGATNTSDEALQINSAGAGLITITNNGTISGAGGSAGGGAGGDAFEATTACTLINNGTIRAGGGGGGAGGTGGQGYFTTTSQNSVSLTKGSDTYYDSVSPWSHGASTAVDVRVQYTANNIDTRISTLPGGLNWQRIAVSPAITTITGSGTYGGYGWTWHRASSMNTQNGGTCKYRVYGTHTGAFTFATSGMDYSSNPTYSVDYNNSYLNVTNTTYTSGGGGGAGGRGQGYNHGSQNGSGGSAGGTNAGSGGTGGSGGGYGASGATGNTGANGNHTNGSGGSGGGAAGKYIRGLSNVTFTNNGTIQGGTA